MAEFDLPPDGASNTQLLLMVQALRAEVHAMREQQSAQTRQLEDLKKSFDNAKAVVSIIKWLAGLGAAIAAIVGVFRVT